MPGFLITCGNCHSDNIVEKSGQKQLDWVADRIKYGEGIQRKCLNCNNEEFSIFRTWLQ